MTDTLTTPVWNGTCHPAADAFPMFEVDRFANLCTSIRETGLITPGWLLPDGTLLAGRNRRMACEAVGVEMRWSVLDAADEEQILKFVMTDNSDRRDMSAGQRAGVAYRVLPLFEQLAKERQVRKPYSVQADLPEQNKPAPQARDEAGAAANSSGRAVGQFKRVMENAPDLAEKVLANIITLDAAEKQVKRQASQREEQQAREIVMAPVVVDASGPGWRLLSGDFRERLMELPAGCVDLIITDPPYPNEFLPLYGDLSKVAQHLLTDDGICVVMTGQIHLDEVMQLMAQHLNYGWMYCQPLIGANSRILARQIMQSWKPWVAFTKNKWPSGRIDWHPDMLAQGARNKDQYRWQQDATPAEMLAIELCPEGGTICDPFMGVGTYGTMALKVGRQFVGVEMDAERFSTSKENFNVYR